MHHKHDDETLTLTLRVPRWLASLSFTLCLHALLLFAVAQLPMPKKKEDRVEFTMAQSPARPPRAATPTVPSAGTPPAPEPRRRRPPPPTPPPTSPVVPALPPSAEPPPNRAQLPVVAYDPTPGPPPEQPPSTWRDRLFDSLATTTPRQPLGALMPSARNLARVAAADARLHDEENETRLIADHGPFFRRGLEALRGNWHPDDVLRRQHDDAVRRCGHENRMTWAVAVIDRDGTVVDVDLKGSSGCAPLDVEAMRAFRRVGRFPNPPQALFVDGEGAPASTARLPVRFLVSFDGGLQVDWR